MTTTHTSPPFLPFVLDRAQVTLNRWISQSTAARDELRVLEGRSMIVDIDNTGLCIELSVAEQKAQIREVDTQNSADIVIRAGVFDLVAILGAKSIAQMHAGEIEFRGSLRVAEGFSQLLKFARPRLEDELAGWIGGMPAYTVSRTGATALEWSAQAIRALELDTSEYLQAETRELPVPAEITEFLSAVETLRDDVDRIAARVERLSARFDAMEAV